MKILAILRMGSIIFALPIFLFCGCGTNVRMTEQGQVGMSIPFDFPQRKNNDAASKNEHKSTRADSGDFPAAPRKISSGIN